MVIDNLERLNKALHFVDSTDEQLDVCTPIESRILQKYTPIDIITSYVRVDLRSNSDIIYIQSLINVLFHDTRANPTQALVNKHQLHLARSLHGAELLREANEVLAKSKEAKHTQRTKKPVSKESVSAMLDGLDPEVLATILANHAKKE